MDQEIANAWIQSSGRAHDVAARDLLDSFQAFASRAGPPEQDRVVWILKSEEMRDWLQGSTSALLVVELPQIPDVFSAATYASAILIRSIMGIGTCPILYQFSTLRASDPDEQSVSGDTGMMVSIITQLLPYVLQKPDISLDFLKNEHFERTSRDPLRLFLIFKRLLESLPKDRCIYIVLDSVVALRQKAKGEEEGVTGMILGLVAKQDLFVKILISWPSSENIVHSMKGRAETESRVSCLRVPRDIGGGCQALQPAWVEQQTEDMIKGLETTS